jgi:hypothetical protein
MEGEGAGLDRDKASKKRGIIYITSVIHEAIERMFENLGRLIGARPVTVIGSAYFCDFF